MKWKVPFADLNLLHARLKNDLVQVFSEVLDSTQFIGFGENPLIKNFETGFAKYLGVSEFVACANGTDSLEMLFKHLQLSSEDEVIVPANTWISTSEAVSAIGGRVVFADVDAKTMNLTAETVEKKITRNTKAIVPVHLYGRIAPMEDLIPISRQHGLAVIEDCAQAHGARLGDQKAGTFGLAGSFSFFPGKNLGALGDAGGVSTSDAELALFLRRLRNHGRTGKADHAFEGRNSRMDGLQAALLSKKLEHLDEWTRDRVQIAQWYDQALQQVPQVSRPEYFGNMSHVYHLYVIQLPENCARDRVVSQFAENGIEVKVHYPKALPFTDAYKHLGATSKDFPVAFSLQNRILSLPIFPGQTQEQVEMVVRTLQRILG